ncbi:MAG TPA: ribonuclease Y [Candidatus Peribacterales bacterium]|nr:ribonuclease Y [Candidatus Peribacterales bacterium]
MEYIIGIIALLLGGGVGFMAAKSRGSGEKISQKLQEKIQSQEREFQTLQSKVAAARGDLKTAEAEAKAKAQQIIAEAKLAAHEERSVIEKESAKLEQWEKDLTKVEGELKEERASLQKKNDAADALRKELSVAAETQRKALENVAKLSQEEAKKELLAEVEKEYSSHLAHQVDLLKQESDRTVEEHARDLLSQAMQRYASEVTSESTATVVPLPSDDMKGRIIGKEGRNITSFERATGVDVIIDDTPDAIVITGYDLVRRYVAKRAMEKLVQDGRIQPARIEEEVEKQKKEVGKMMVQFGERACEELGIKGYHPDLIKIIGRLRFRTSYGQNVLKHSVEMAHLGRMLAEEIGADVSVVTEGCLLHDIGKALDHEVKGTHVEIGVEICKRYKVRPEVIHCVAAHHEDIPMETAEAFVVAAADAISGSRPGARRESMEAYVQRLKELEDVARSFTGVQKAYAISAGREVRVFVDAEQVDDLAQRKLAKDIAQKIEAQLAYPGVIKVNVIRERRVIETAQ